MNNVEKRLAKEKQRLDSMTAPDELESRLRNALRSSPPKKKQPSKIIWKLVTVAIFVIALVGYQYNAVAFYGKKLFGFEELMADTLIKLNEEGLGQSVEKRVQLEDGTTFTVNGIMADENQLLMYYTLTNSKGIPEQTIEHFRLTRLTGFLTNSYSVGGTYMMNEEGTELKGNMAFEPVSPFSKKLSLKFMQHINNNQATEGTLSFSYNPNKAMQTELKQTIKKKVKVDKGTITFRSITATPTMTVIHGKLNVENYDRVNLPLDDIELRANGKPIDGFGAGIRSSFTGVEFDINYDALPKNIDSLELVVNEFVGYQELDEKISLLSVTNKPIILDGKELYIKEVKATSDGVEMTVATGHDVMLDGVSIEVQNEIIPLRTIVNQHDVKQENGKEMKERTLLFDTKVEPETLLIDGIHFMKSYDIVIEIPIH
ncbi:DUF4179 domain-containing protein [Sutcliffiella halmapala]|uniref:DUF4179 domain-containing protein n=1 Tax=Sutcliffiella halmapala TaxID=79882 RepID=UPI0009954AA8|nr:DUF4179 domain-containing protein [Sutcliffiella halmapala]